MTDPVELFKLSALTDTSVENAALEEIARIQEKVRTLSCINHADRQMYSLAPNVGAVCQECAAALNQERK